MLGNYGESLKGIYTNVHRSYGESTGKYGQLHGKWEPFRLNASFRAARLDFRLPSACHAQM